MERIYIFIYVYVYVYVVYVYVYVYYVDGSECIKFYYFACISSHSACFVYLYILIDIKYINYFSLIIFFDDLTYAFRNSTIK